jgi:hypothetical protein
MGVGQCARGVSVSPVSARCCLCKRPPACVGRGARGGEDGGRCVQHSRSVASVEVLKVVARSLEFSRVRITRQEDLQVSEKVATVRLRCTLPSGPAGFSGG